MIHVVNYYFKAPEGVEVINTTSRSSNWSKGLSPFFCGPCDLYDGHVALNCENAWQYSKIYEYYLEEDGEVGERYFKWAIDGWNNPRANRYPMGKGVIPLYSYWDGEKLPYVEARKKIYIPKYAEAVQKTDAFAKLKKIYDAGGDLYLRGFDAHNTSPPHNYIDMINNKNIKFGHEYVLAMMLEDVL